MNALKLLRIYHIPDMIGFFIAGFGLCYGMIENELSGLIVFNLGLWLSIIVFLPIRKQWKKLKEHLRLTEI